MKVLWEGSITYGLVTIPVSFYPATRRARANLPRINQPSVAIHADEQRAEVRPRSLRDGLREDKIASEVVRERTA